MAAFTFLLFHIPALAASPAATQAWVRNYVATARTERVAIDVSPVTFNVVNDQGEAETVTLTFERADCGAMRVEDSNVPGMTNGTLFAENGEHSYANTANSACTGFSGAMEHVGWMMLGGHYEYTTNGTEIASNIVYVASNEVRELRFVLDVGGEMFSSVLMKDGRHKCASASNPSRTFYLRGCTVSERVKDALLRPRAGFSVFALLFPSCYAEKLGEKTVYKSVRNGDYITDYWRAHYYTDSDDAALSVSCGDVTIRKGEDEMTFDLSDLWLIRINSGVDFCELKDNESLTEDELVAELKKRLGPGRVAQIKNSDAWNAVQKKLIEAAKLEQTILSITCPEEGSDERFEPQYVPHVCGDWKGECGNWKCGLAACTNVVSSVEGDSDHPAEHEYDVVDGEDGNGACAICIHCRHIPEDESLHDGWHNDYISSLARGGVALYQCVCECGKLWLDHVYKRKTEKYISAATPDLGILINPNVCYEVWMCDRCTNVVEDLMNDGGTVTAGAHNELHDSKYTAVTVTSPSSGREIDVCRCSYTCRHFVDGEDLGCGAVRTEDFDHVLDKNNGKATEPIDDEYHALKVPCANGFEWWTAPNSNWCGYVVEDADKYYEPHSVGVDKVMRWDDPKYPAARSYHQRVRVCGSLDMNGNVVTNLHQCGYEKATHEGHDFYGATTYGDGDATTHAVSNRCQTCNGTFLGEREPHVRSGPDVCTYIDNLRHTATNTCARCGVVYWPGLDAEYHTPTENLVAYGYLTQETHCVSNFCAGCHAWYRVDIEDHVPKYDEPTRCVTGSNHTHKAYNVCDLCMKPASNGTEEVEFLWNDAMACEESDDPACWELSTNTNDKALCKYHDRGCDNFVWVQHQWVSLGDLNHYCINGGHNLEHYNEDHVWIDEYLPLHFVCGRCGYERTARCEYCPCKEDTCDRWSEDLKMCGCQHCQHMYGGYDDGELCECGVCTYPTINGLQYKLHRGAALRSGPTGGWAEVRSFAEQNSGLEGAIVIPDTVEHNGASYTVTTIDEGDGSSVREDSLITSVTAGSMLATIKDKAFGGHTNLTSVSFPGATTIGEYAFYATQLKSVSLPAATSVGDYAFNGCHSLTNVFLPVAAGIGDYAFDGCHLLTSASLPAAMDIGYSAFAGCTSLTNLVLHSVTNIDSAAFEVVTNAHLHLAQTNVAYNVAAPDPNLVFAAIHFPSNKALNGVSYPAPSIHFGGGDVPIVWEEVPAQ